MGNLYISGTLHPVVSCCCIPPARRLTPAGFLWARLMSGFTVNVKSNMDAVIKDMGRIRFEVVDQALPRALNRVVEMARTQTARNLVADGYNFRNAEIKAALKIVRASYGMKGVRMIAPRNAETLMRFNPVQTSAGVTVKVHGSRKLIKGAFIGQLQNGRYGVYIEDKTAGKLVLRNAKAFKRGSKGGWHSMSVRKLYGPSIGGAFVNKKLMDSLDEFVGKKFSERMRYEIGRVIK